jgi:hypothetical protein
MSLVKVRQHHCGVTRSRERAGWPEGPGHPPPTPAKKLRQDGTDGTDLHGRWDGARCHGAVGPGRQVRR